MTPWCSSACPGRYHVTITIAMENWLTLFLPGIVDTVVSRSGDVPENVLHHYLMIFVRLLHESAQVAHRISNVRPRVHQIA